jgi:uncharacterized membrane protein YfcA
MLAELPLLCGFAFLAGFVDAIAGGGGLIQIPALFLCLPQAAPAALLGTNKFSSICGTAVAMTQYLRRVPVDWRAILPAGLAAFTFSYFGAMTVAAIPGGVLRPLVLFLLVAAGIYTFWNKNFGDHHRPRFAGRTQTALAVALGAAIGFYDGFFGPGTGSFLIFAFIGLFGFDFLTASASSKVINVATNLSAVAYFAVTDNILFALAVPMGLCNILGGWLGARLAILKGNRFVRGVFLIVVAGLIARLGYDVMFKQ